MIDMIASAIAQTMKSEPRSLALLLVAHVAR